MTNCIFDSAKQNDRRTISLGVMAGLVLFAGLAFATPPVGYTAVTTRTPIKSNLLASQWGSSPLFNFALQTSAGDWGYDLVHATHTFSTAAADGTPTQSGWHDHPVAMGLLQVVSGGVWAQDQDSPSCLVYLPAGTMFVEGSGHAHNVFNFDKKTPAVILATWFLERFVSGVGRDRSDPTTGSSTVASPPPTALCPGSAIPPAQ